MITGVQIQYYVWKSERNWVQKCHCALARRSRLWRQQPSSLSFVFGPLRFHGKFAKITRRGNGGGAAIVVVNANRLVTLRILSIRQIQTMFDPVLIISFHTFQPTPQRCVLPCSFPVSLSLYGNNKSTGKETSKTHLCALSSFILFVYKSHLRAVVKNILIYGKETAL